jgi:hypothetical protein
VIDPLQQGTPAYAKWGNDYYSTLVTTFPGDILVRAWAAVLGVCQLPFDQINVMRPSWIDPYFERSSSTAALYCRGSRRFRQWRRSPFSRSALAQSVCALAWCS